MNVVRCEVNELVTKELDAAIEKNGYFNSRHEGFAVMLEELEECEKDIENLRHFIYSNHDNSLWNSIKNNSMLLEGIRDIRVVAVNLACEAIQVAAMADKMMMFENGITSNNLKNYGE